MSGEWCVVSDKWSEANDQWWPARRSMVNNSLLHTVISELGQRSINLAVTPGHGSPEGGQPGAVSDDALLFCRLTRPSDWHVTSV